MDRHQFCDERFCERANGAIVFLTGVRSGGSIAGPASAEVAAEVVLRNEVIVGSVNANVRHRNCANTGC